mmetsp:Transcript_58205/g.151240  ORF Transcript_58205/g.151240 Transcript_58205/m.151240 type:complete len:225 (+) Transcript_58205:810-1484(+)
MRRDMHGSPSPIWKKAANATASPAEATTSPALAAPEASHPYRAAPAGGDCSAASPLPLSSAAGRVGRATPREDTVEQTQNMLKQEKPMSSCAAVRMAGGEPSLRTRYTNRMYANMSGEAHFEMTCTACMHPLDTCTLARLWENRSISAMAMSTSFRIGTTIAYRTTSVAPLPDPVVLSRWTRPAVDSVQDWWSLSGLRLMRWPITFTRMLKLNRLPVRPGTRSM